MNRFLMILLIFSFSSCQNYENEEYIKCENEAIQEIILEMTNFEKLESYNNSNIQKYKLYLFSELDTFVTSGIKPTGYLTSINGVDYPKEIIKENKKEFEEKLEKYKLEESLFADFRKGKIKPRNLNYKFGYKKLTVEIIDSEKIEKLESFETKENELGFLFLSRIIFNRNYTKGYLYFDFICGFGCAFSNNIEIQKINGKWKITEYFSGGVA